MTGKVWLHKRGLAEGSITITNTHQIGVVRDLPVGQSLLVLLRTAAIHHDLAGMSMSALDPAFRNDIVESTQRIATMKGIQAPAAVPIAAYPLLVTFGEVAIPASVEEVDPENLPASFGPGFRIASLAVEVTDDPVTTGIKQRLPWLTEGSRYVAMGPSLVANPDPYDHSTISTLAFEDFLAEA